MPWEEESMLATPLRSRPATVSTPGMVAGAPTWMFPPTRLPAAATITTSFCSAYRNAASQLWGHSGDVLPSEMLMTRAPLSTAQRTASGIWSWSLLPPGLAEPSQVETDSSCASGATPTTPSGPTAGLPAGPAAEPEALAVGLAVASGAWCPRPASMVATRVPCSGLAPILSWPLALPAPEMSAPPASTPPKSGCRPSTPLSITATLTPAPLETSQALVMPDSASQYSLSRHESAWAGAAKVSAAVDAPPARAKAINAEAVRRPVALVIQVLSADAPAARARAGAQLLGKTSGAGSSDAEGNSVKNIVFAAHGRGDAPAGDLGQALQDPPPDQAAGADHVHPPGVHVGQRGPLFPGHFEQLGAGFPDRVQVQFGAMDRRRRVLRQAQRVRRDRGDGAGHADDGGGAFQRNGLCRLVDGGVDVGLRGGDLIRGGRIAAQVPFGHPDAADVDRAGRDDAVGVAQHELRASAAEVHHQHGVLPAGGQHTAGAGEGQRGFLVAGDHLGFDAEDVADAVDEDLAVAGIAGGGRGHEAYLFGAVLADEGSVVPGRGEGALKRFLGQFARGVHALAKPDHAHFPHDIGQPRGGRPCCVACAHICDQQADR